MIKLRQVYWVLLGLFCACSTAQSADLFEVYQRALQSDPLMREAEATRLAALESKPQARSALLPQLNATSFVASSDSTGASSFLDSRDLLDANGNPIPDPDNPGANLQEPFVNNATFDSDSDDTQWRLELRQTVFRWDQMILLGQADKTIAQAEADYAAARQDLMLRASQRYFDVLAAQDTLASEQANKEAIKRQLDQAEKRFEVGLIAITDVQEAQAAYDQAVASEIAAKRSLATSRENLREITGDYIEDLVAPGATMPLIAPSPEDENAWVNRALEQNFGVISSRLQSDIARDEVRVRRTGHFPTVDLVVSRTDFDREGEQGLNGLPGFPGSNNSSNVTDTVSLQLSLPLYGGGFVSSRVKEAVYQHRAAKERTERIARETERATRDSYLGVLSEISRVKALKRALQSTETALKATEAGFEVGTRTTVDVLNARRDLFQAETDYARSRYDYIIEVLRLKLAAGTLSKADIEEANDWIK